MIAETGNLALCLLMALSLICASLPLGQHQAERAYLLRSSITLMFAMAVLAFGCLLISFLSSDFSLRLVDQHSNLSKPLLYKITGLWGNHEGSMLLWLLSLCGYGLWYAWRYRSDNQLYQTSLAIQSAITGMMTSFVLLTSNPFTRQFPAPPEGRGFNPVLQDIGLAIHPPTLYLGYVGYAVVFSLSLAALLTGRLDKQAIHPLRHASLLAWGWLTLGIGLGSWWAYRELGWGGWWFWDPVENASLLPWLLGTALLHSLIVLEKRQHFGRWVLWLGMSCFILSLLGTFLVRSGVLTSVHSFALDPERGVFVLAMLSILTFTGWGSWAWRVEKINTGKNTFFSPLSRETAMLVQNLLLLTACATVLLGTIYPLIMQIFGVMGITVGYPYYNQIFLPLALVSALIMGVAPMISWKHDRWIRLWPHCRKHLLPIPICLALAFWLHEGSVIAFGLIATGSWLTIVTLLSHPKASPSMKLAHIGFGLMLAGIAGTTLLRHESEIALSQGETTHFAGYDITYANLETTTSADHRSLRATLLVKKDQHELGTLTPEKRLFTLQGMPTSESARIATGLGEVYAAIGDNDESGTIGLRLYYKPGIHLVWSGFLLMAAGSVLAVRQRRKRQS